MSISSRLLRYVLPYRMRVVWIVICMTMIALFSFLTIGTLKPLIDLVFPPADGKISIVPSTLAYLKIKIITDAETYAMEHRWQVFVICCGFLVLVGILRFIFSYFQVYLTNQLSERVMLDVRNDLYSHLHHLSLRFFTQKDTASQMSRVTIDVDVIGRGIIQGFGEIIKEPLIMIGLLVLMILSHWQLSIITLVCFPIISFPLIRFGHYIREQTSRLQEEKSQLNTILLETISGIRIVKAFGMEDYEKARFLKKVKDGFHTALRIARINALSSPLTELFGVIAVVGTLMIAAYFVYRGRLTAGEFGTFIVALVSFYQPLKRLSAANNYAQQGLAGAERVFQLLDIQSDIIELPNAKNLPLPQKEIQFHHVCFEYQSDIPVLHDIHISLPMKKVIAIVGPSGAGKSTLVNLLPRFYDPTSGYISIDGKNIKDVTLKSLREQIGMVTQDTFLFDDTVFNNIAYGHPNFEREKVYHAAKIAHADEFILKLSEGYNTRIGERGVKLSGGQKQRITIARAILKNPPILIFDEATSSLDAESERLVQDALEKLMEDRTTFIIAHRLSTILRADLILVLDHGRLIEQGSHKELLEKQGIYTKLYQTQFAEAMFS